MFRRDFLKTLAATAAAATASKILRAQSQNPKRETLNSKLNIGLIGCGGQGRYIMSSALANPRAHVIAVCDVDAEQAEKARAQVEKSYADDTTSGTYRSCATYRDHRELLARPDIDAVLIATPDHWHALTVVAAARAGKHIYCEKPAASSIPEGRTMVDAITSSGVTCQIGSQQRSSREFQRVIDLTRGGYLGKITAVKVGLPEGTQARPKNPPPPHPETPPPTFDYNRWLGPAEFLPYFRDRCHFQWRWNYAFAGGQVSDWIGHHYDIAALALGVTHTQPIAINKAHAVFIDDSPLYNTAADYSFEAAYANGALIDVSSDYPMGVRIEGSEGWVYADRGIIEHSSESLRRLTIPSNAQIYPRGPRGHVDQFIDAALTGSAPRCPITDAHNVAAVAHLANAAFRSGRTELRWNPAIETPIDAPNTHAYLRRTYRAPWTL